MLINGFPIQILLPKSKEKWTEVISRLLSTFVTEKLQENLNFSVAFKETPPGKILHGRSVNLGASFHRRNKFFYSAFL